MTPTTRKWSIIGACAAVPLVATPALAQAAGVEDKYRWLTFTIFAVVIGITMFVTYLAAKRVRSASG